MASDAERVIRSFSERGLALELTTLDLCFVMLLRLRATEHGLASFSEDQLGDAFAHVCSIVEPTADNVAARASHAIRRLRQQRLLTRVDGAGVRRSGEFSLSRLASAIVDFHVEDDVLTPHSLELLSGTLLASLSEVREHARRATAPEQWQASVVGPLRITASDLILGIERRQRGLDVQQEQFQREISQLLESDWFDAVGQCQSLLDDTAQTLSQLSQLLLRFTHQFETVLQDIFELAVEAGSEVAEAVAQRVLGQVDRIAAWGAARQQAWSEYYDHVHRYLRDVVRLDPSRALTQRLREQLHAHGARPFSLTLATAPPLSMPRPVEPPSAPLPPRRPRKPRDSEPQEVSPAKPVDPLREQVGLLLDAGVESLSEVTARATEGLDEATRFRTAGRVAALVAELSQPRETRHRPWVVVDDELAIEQWRLARAVGAR